MSFNCQDLIHLFDDLFKESERTILRGGAAEPLYLPANNESSYHQIIFTEDYFASALHEVAHWCVAGVERRRQIDYGYWYKPDGRDPAAQRLFEQLESKPQALEWIFSVAAGAPFRISADNIANNNCASQHFKNLIHQQALHYLQTGLPQRAESFKQALLQFYRRTDLFSSVLFLAEYLC